MTSEIDNKFIKYVETLENTELANIASGEMGIEYDPEAIEFQTVNYNEDNWRIVESGDVSGTSDYHQLWVKVLGIEDYDQADCRDLSDEQILEVANFQRRKLIGSIEHVTATVDEINDRFSVEMESE